MTVRQDNESKEAWTSAAAKRAQDMTDEERSHHSTPPRTADEVTQGGSEEKRTPEDVSKVQPVNLDCVLAEAAAMFGDESQDTCGRPLRPMDGGLPAKQEVQETTANAIRLLDPAAEAPNDSPRPLPPRPGTSSRRPESSAGRLIVYKTAAQKRAEQEARRKRMESENDPAAAGNVARPGTSSRKMSALPPLEERRRAKHAGVQDMEVVAVSEAKGGACWQIDAADFIPSSCASPTKKVSAKQEANVFSMDEDVEGLSPVKKPSSQRADVFSLED